MNFRFANIEWLVLLPVALLFVALMGRKLRMLSRARRITVLALRSLLFALLILALARLEITRTSNDLAVMFLVDDSSSIPHEMREYAKKFIQQSVEKMGAEDSLGILLFGGDASIERSPQARPESIEGFQSVVSRDQTNMAEAVRLAMAAFPAHAKKRIVLMSDGNQTVGDVEESVRRAAANNVAVDVVPMAYEHRDDIIVEDLVVENQVAIDEPFDVKVMVKSPRDLNAKMNILRDGQIVATQQVDIEGSKKNVFVLPTQAQETGFHVYQAQIETSNDTNAENNQSYGFTMAQGEPKVLLVEGAPPEQNLLTALLRMEKIDVDLIAPGDFPNDPVRLQEYNSIILSNVAAADMTRGQMQLIERVVHESGMGLIMIGGEHSFGAGGWQDTPVEEALPVEMEIKHKKILPKGALALILHTAEIPQQEYWARTIAVAALNVLSSRDDFGALAYDWQAGDQWIVPFGPAEDKVAARKAIMEGSYGDMPQFAPTMQMAFDALKASNASSKHIIVISDGDAQPPQPALVDSIRKSKITISTVQVAGHGASTTEVMKEIAKRGAGRFYEVKNNSELPQIFIKEASVIRRSLIIEEPFVPVSDASSDLLAGIGPREYPRLLGYVGASPKDLADQPLKTDKDDPLLAHWRYGVGKTVAFTSDVYRKWAAEWYNWNKMSKFWSQVVRWTLRPQTSRNLQMSTSIEEGKAKVAIDAVDDEGRFINFLQFDASLIAPDFQSEKIDFRQVGPGRYEAQVPVESVGTHLVTATAKGPNDFQDFITGGIAMSYSPEFRTSRSNDGLMKKISEIGKGRVLDEQMNVFDRNLPSSQSPQPLFPLLLAAAILLLPIDIFFRRVLIDWSMVANGLTIARRYAVSIVRPRHSRQEREERIEALLDAKKQAQQTRMEEVEKKSSTAYKNELLERLEKSKADEDMIGQTQTKPPETPAATKEKIEQTGKSQQDDFTAKLLEAKRRAKK